MPDKNNEPPKGELLVYQGQGLDSPVQVRLEGETVWLNQKLMADYKRAYIQYLRG
jgi:hypothetical protein